MKFLEAIEYLKQGKKIRCEEWTRGSFILFDMMDGIINEYGFAYEPSISDFSDNWALYEDESKKTIRLNFGEALQYLKDGKKVTRSIWNNDKITLQLIDDGQPLFLPYIQVKTYSGQHCQWTPHHQDLLADDYILLDD